jgi:adenylosuccinate synthase
MSNSIVVGAQWGDEGKGKIVDYLTENSDVVVRAAGGNNAGHTVINGGTKYMLHLIPSGILWQDKPVSSATASSWTPLGLIVKRSTNCWSGRRHRAGKPPHLRDRPPRAALPPGLDQAREAKLGDKKIGTTGRGIGPSLRRQSPPLRPPRHPLDPPIPNSSKKPRVRIAEHNARPRRRWRGGNPRR